MDDTLRIRESRMKSVTHRRMRASRAWGLAASVATTASVVAAVALAAMLGGCRETDKGGHKVADSLIDSLRMIDPKDEKRLDAMALAVKTRGMDETEQLVSLMHGNDAALADKAFAVVLNLGPLALNPIIDSLNPEKADACTLQMKQAIELELGERKRVAAVLNKLLDDKRPVPLPPQPENTEEKLPPRRLCDEAYISLRQLLSLDETEDQHFMNERLFLDMKEADRDKEIQKAKKSKRFTPLMEYFHGDE